MFTQSHTSTAAVAEHQPLGLAELLSPVLTPAIWAYTCFATLC